MKAKKETKVIITEQIHGEGELLFLVATVDREDCEDTTTELWLAEDESHLEEQLKMDFYGVESVEELEEMEEDEFGPIWDDEYGFSIIPKLIGKIK
jgi:hypothetical protein